MSDDGSLELHVIMSDDIDVVFHPPSLTFLKVNRRAAAALESYTEGHTTEDCAVMHGCSSEEIKALLQKLQEEIEKQAVHRPASMVAPKGNQSRLNLLVSMDCNMRCVYCYAGGGNYGKTRQLMSKEVATQAVDLFTKSDEFYCNQIMFFGGEPSLNVPVIRVVCEHLAGRAQSGQTSRMPALGMVTNGLHLSDELLALISRYNIGVTVSLDGPPEVNDLQRIDAGGKGTYGRATRSIGRLQQATNGRQPEMVEATITRRHTELGITYDDLRGFFTTEFGIGGCYLGVDASVPDEEYIAWNMAHRTSILDDLVKGKVTSYNIWVLEMLVPKKIRPYLCKVGFSSFSVDAGGGIYPCYQLLDDHFYMGNVFEPDVLTSERLKRVQETLRANGKYEHEQCRTCWARGLCIACPAEFYKRTGTLYGRSDVVCTVTKRSLEIILCRLTQWRTDKSLWSKIVGNLTRETRLGSLTARSYPEA